MHVAMCRLRPFGLNFSPQKQHGFLPLLVLMARTEYPASGGGGAPAGDLAG